MANADRPNGFKPVRPLRHRAGPVYRGVTAGQSFLRGDPLVLTAAGTVSLATGANRRIHAVSAEDCVSAVPASVKVYLARDWVFEVQCSGTYAAATYDGTLVDMEGSTGVFECNENASVVGTLLVLGMVSRPDCVAGAHSKVLVIFAAPQGDQDDDEFAVAAVGAGANATFGLAVPAPRAGTVRTATLISTLATSGSGGSDKWVVTLTDGAGNDQGVARSTATAEIAANTLEDLAPTTNLTVAKGEILLATFTKTGSPTDLSTAKIAVVWYIREA